MILWNRLSPSKIHLARRASLVRLLALALVFGAASLRADSTWIHDDSDRAPRLSVEQSIWAMGGLPRDGEAWSRAEQVARIAAAGFDGIMVSKPRRSEETEWRALAETHGLEITLHCSPSSLSDLTDALQAADRMHARGLVAMIQPTFVTAAEGEQKIRTMMAAARAAGIPFYVETHRRTITQDLLLTQLWAETIPGLQFHGDLSHFVVSYDVRGEPEARVRAAFDAILARTGMLDGRVGNGQQVQIDVGPGAESPHARRFARWWKQAMLAWLAQAAPGDIFVFKSELGPPSYSIVGLDGKELSDRWEQAIVLRDLAIRTWNEAVAESGRGQPYSTKSEGARGPGVKAKMPPELLQPALSKLRTLRGECYRLGTDFYLSGQPSQPDYEDAAREGVKTVINVRMEAELGGLGFPVDATVEGAGMKYFHIPVSPDDIDDQVAERLLTTIDQAEKPLLLSGSNGNRLWGIWALYLGVKYGVPLEETAKVAATVGVKKLVIDGFVADYLARKGR